MVALIFTVRIVKHLHRLLREVVDTLPLETLKARLDRALSYAGLVEDIPNHGRGWDWTSFKGTFEPELFYQCDFLSSDPKFPLTLKQTDE